MAIVLFTLIAFFQSYLLWLDNTGTKLNDELELPSYAQMFSQALDVEGFSSIQVKGYSGFLCYSKKNPLRLVEVDDGVDRRTKRNRCAIENASVTYHKNEMISASIPFIKEYIYNKKEYESREFQKHLIEVVALKKELARYAEFSK
jgi:hypothetical protein